MPIFGRKSRENEITTQLKAAKANRQRVAEALDVTQAAVITLQSDAVRAARAGGDRLEVLDRTAASVAAAEQKISALVTALDQIDGEIAELDRELAVLTEAKQRKATAAECADIDRDFDRYAVAFYEALENLSLCAARISPTIYEASGLAGLSKNLGPMVTGEIDQVKLLLADHVRAVLNGSAPATLRTPDAEPVAPIAVPQPDVTGLVAKRNLAWSEGLSIRFARRGDLVALPVHLAKHAIELSAAVIPGSDEGSRLLGDRKSPDAPLRLVDCVTLDAASAAAKAEEVETQSANAAGNDPGARSGAGMFEQIDRGQSYTMTVTAA